MCAYCCACASVRRPILNALPNVNYPFPFSLLQVTSNFSQGIYALLDDLADMVDHSGGLTRTKTLMFECD